jgi:hypothetical protein
LKKRPEGDTASAEAEPDNYEHGVLVQKAQGRANRRRRVGNGAYAAFRASLIFLIVV